MSQDNINNGQYSRRQFCRFVAGVVVTLSLKATSLATSAEYVVKKGDTLITIAKEYGVPWSQIANLNDIRDLNKIRAGKKLVIPEQRQPPTIQYFPQKIPELEEKISSLLEQKKIAKREESIVRGILYTQSADLENILKFYGQNPEVFHNIMAQESGYKIESVGPYGELGTAQLQKKTADNLAERIAYKYDALHYPQFDIRTYRFENLKADYWLNNLMKAAYLTSISNAIKKDGINKESLFAELKTRGINLNYGKFGVTKKELKETFVDLWKNHANYYQDTLVPYLYYNANGKISDEVIYHMALLMKNARHYGTIRQKVLSHKN